MTPGTVSKAVSQPWARAERRSSGIRSVPVSPRKVRVIVRAVALTGDLSQYRLQNKQNRPMRSESPGAPIWSRSNSGPKKRGSEFALVRTHLQT